MTRFGILVALLALTVSACGNDAGSSTETKSDQTPAPAPEVETAKADVTTPDEAPAPSAPVAENTESAEVPAPAAAPAPVQTASNAKPASFTQCAVCHKVEEGARATIGPNLYGIVGAEAGKQEGFAYSPAMRESGLTWDEATLDRFLANPQSVVRGNRMAFVGERNETRRKEIIDYLASLTSN